MIQRTIVKMKRLMRKPHACGPLVAYETYQATRRISVAVLCPVAGKGATVG